jgi:hypothetical protein
MTVRNHPKSQQSSRKIIPPPPSPHSILGYYWYLRLRGHEIDAVDFQRKSFGNTYALQKQTNDSRELARLLMKLCEKTGRRLRRAPIGASSTH